MSGILPIDNVPDSPVNEDEKCFMHNWIRNQEEVLQLLISEAIWKQVGFNKGAEVGTTRTNLGNGRMVTEFYVNGKKELSYYTDDGSDSRNPSWTIIEHKEENGRTQRRGELRGPEALWRD